MTKKTKAHLDAENDLPSELREAFNQLVDEYRTAAKKHVPGYKGGTPNFKIMSGLIRGGWRKTAEDSN